MEKLVDIKDMIVITKDETIFSPIYNIKLNKNYLKEILKTMDNLNIPGDEITVSVMGKIG